MASVPPERPPRVPPNTGTPDAPTSPPPGHPRALTVLVWLLLVEAAFMLVLALVLVIKLFTAQRQTQLWVPLAEIGLSLFVVIALVLMARGLQQGRRWARSPAITLQLVGLPFAGRLIQFGGIRILLGVPMGVVLLTALVLLFATSSGAEYAPKRDPDDASEQASGPDSE